MDNSKKIDDSENAFEPYTQKCLELLHEYTNCIVQHHPHTGMGRGFGTMDICSENMNMITKWCMNPPSKDSPSIKNGN